MVDASNGASAISLASPENRDAPGDEVWAIPRGRNALRGSSRPRSAKAGRQLGCGACGPIVGTPPSRMAPSLCSNGALFGGCPYRQATLEVETEDTIGAPTVGGAGSSWIERPLPLLFRPEDRERALEIRSGGQVRGRIAGRESDGKEKWIVVNGYDESAGHCAQMVGAWTYETAEQINGTPALVNGKTIVLGGCDAMVRVIDVTNGKAVNEVEVEAESSAP